MAWWRIFCEDVFEMLGHKAPLRIVRARITAVFVLMNTTNPNAEEWIRYPGRSSRIRKIEVGNKDSEKAEKEIETKSMKSTESVKRPDNAVTVAVKETAMLL